MLKPASSMKPMRSCCCSFPCLSHLPYVWSTEPASLSESSGCQRNSFLLRDASPDSPRASPLSAYLLFYFYQRSHPSDTFLFVCIYQVCRHHSHHFMYIYQLNIQKSPMMYIVLVTPFIVINTKAQDHSHSGAK